MDLVSAVLDGILLGGLYALFAAGLSLIFGVMRLVNIAHGDLFVLSAFIALMLTAHLGVHPLASLVLVVPLMALLGYSLQRAIFNRTLGDDVLPPLLVSFGLSVFLQNALLQIFSADSQRLHAGNLETLHIDLPGGIAVGVLPCLMFIVAIIVISGLQLALTAIRDSEPAAESVGVDNYHTKFFIYFLTAGATGSVGALIYLQKLRISPDAAFSVNDWTAFCHIHRRHRWYRTARGTAHRHDRVLPASLVLR